MDENKQEFGQKFSRCENCGCMGHSHCGGHYHGHFLLRWLLGIVLLALVFAIGVKVGEFKSEFGGYGHMRGGYPMMRQPMMLYNGTPGSMTPANNMMYFQATTTTSTLKK
jgi:hypothetical protein